MNWTCKHCGKRLEFSEEQLTETRGIVVCPQCLASEQMPGYSKSEKRQKPGLKNNVSSVSNSSKPAASTPPPHRPKPGKAAAASATEGATTPPPHRAKRQSGNKKSKKKAAGRRFWMPRSTWGCLWRSVVYTLIFLVAYIVFGLLLQGV